MPIRPGEHIHDLLARRVVCGEPNARKAVPKLLLVKAVRTRPRMFGMAYG